MNKKNFNIDQNVHYCWVESCREWDTYLWCSAVHQRNVHHPNARSNMHGCFSFWHTYLLLPAHQPKNYRGCSRLLWTIELRFYLSDSKSIVDLYTNLTRTLKIKNLIWKMWPLREIFEWLKYAGESLGRDNCSFKYRKSIFPLFLLLNRHEVVIREHLIVHNSWRFSGFTFFLTKLNARQLNKK